MRDALAAAIAAVIITLPFFAGAFSATSTSFYVRQNLLSGAGSSTLPYGTTTDFRIIPAGGEPALGIGTTTSYEVRSGFLHGLQVPALPVYEQAHYHWRQDDGTETTATSKTSGVEDTSVANINKLSAVRLRLSVSNEGGTQYSYASQQFRLEYGLLVSTCAAVASWTQVGSGGAVWGMSDSASLTNAADTTNISAGVGGVSDTNASFLSSNGGVRDTGSDTGSLLVSSDSFVELEYSIQAEATAADEETYCFRVTNAGSASLFEYAQYPEATIAAGSLTFSTDSGTEAFPALTPGTPVSTSTILSITSANGTGFSVSLIRDTVAATMDLNTDSAVLIPDKTDWMAPPATTTVGGSTASTTQPQTLQFRVRLLGTDVPNYASAWWGSADTTAAALFGGIPSTTQAIINRSTAAGSGTVARVQYHLDAPATQKTGAYSGSVTYTAVANP